MIVAGISLIASSLQAAVPIGTVQTFDTRPPAVDWSTFNAPGAGGNVATAAALDTAIQTNNVAMITNQVIIGAGAAPGGNALAQWGSGLSNLVTRPTGNSYTILMATIQNTTPNTLTAPSIAYDLTLPSPYAGEDAELGGHRTYYSTTGLDNSWTVVPELTTSNAGPHLATLALAPGLPPGGTLYLAFVDDNGGPGTDGSFAIDNFIVVTNITAPVITQQPQGTNLVVAQTIRVSVRATGLGLTYAWFKDGAPLDTVANPSAATPNLVINNAQLADSGQYRCTIANPAGGVISNPAQVNVGDDHQAPRFIFASENPSNLKGFTLFVDEPLCVGVGCSGDATLFFNWVIEPTDGSAALDVSVVTITGTNVSFETLTDRDPTKSYRIRAADNGAGASDIMDLFENRVPLSQSITSAPSRIFVQGVNGYTGVEDTELEQGAEFGGPDAIHGTAPRILVDGANQGGESHGLLKFKDIFGNGPTQIPLGARIISATLIMQHTATSADGNPVNVYRMVSEWSQSTATYNSFVAGITNDGVEALVNPDFTIISAGIAVPFTLNIDCAVSVQAWSDGFPNNGWGMINTGGDGYRFDSSAIATGPQLAVVFERVVCPTTAPVITQNPQPITASEGSTVQLTVGVGNACSSTFQWQKNGANFAVTPGPSLTLQNATPGDNGQYRLIVTKITGGASVTSAAAQVTINPDTVRPVVLRVINTNNTSLVVTFSKVMGPTAAVPGNYTQNGVAASGAALAADGRSVTLTTAARTFPTAYTLTITGVRDNRAVPNLIDPNPTVVPLTTVSVISAWGGAWRYNTNNQDATPNWKSVATGSLDGTWQTGNDLFGTETDAGTIALFPTPLVTALPPNTNTPPDMVTFYFRKDVTLPALPAGTSYAINHFIDDGAVFYIDGVEIGRYNMPATPITYTNKAVNAPDATLNSLSFSASAGGHVLAVEVHQGGATVSSDMLFGAQVVAVPTASPRLTINHVGTNAVVHWSADTKWQLRSAGSVTGNYNAVGVPASSPLGSYSTPTGTNNQFFRLHYIGP